MQLAQAERLVQRALAAARLSGEDLTAALEALPAPIYVTDAQGVVTAFNEACVRFAGRRPTVGKDRWCVTWKAYTEAGETLPFDRGPMAVAINERRSVRGVYAVAERPDGSRVTFMPFPTPLLDEAGRLMGAINLLIDVTDPRQVAGLRTQARRCLRLAAAAADAQTAASLLVMATECEAKADALEARQAATAP